MGPKFLGFLNCSLGPGIFNYCPAGSVAEFVFLAAGCIPFISLDIQIAYIYIVVAT